jgi:hypothetical protein
MLQNWYKKYKYLYSGALYIVLKDMLFRCAYLISFILWQNKAAQAQDKYKAKNLLQKL